MAHSTALVTGGSTGFGRALVAALTARDVRVVTDEGITNHWRDLFAREEIEVIVA